METHAHSTPENAAHEDAHHPAPLPRDPDLPTVSDTAVAFFAAGALFVTLVALIVLL